jgi:hypothetical protein
MHNIFVNRQNCLCERTGTAEQTEKFEDRKMEERNLGTIQLRRDELPRVPLFHEENLGPRGTRPSGAEQLRNISVSKFFRLQSFRPRSHWTLASGFQLLALLLLTFCLAVSAAPATSTVEQWGVFEIALKGPSDGNPFLDVRLSAVFSNGSKRTEAAGFYDGDGIYKIRFMPDQVGEWHYETRANRWPLTGHALPAFRHHLL